jgi:hypothetical protein
MTAADPPVEEVYCKGPRDHPHDRFLVAAYERAHAVPTPTPAAWTPLPVFNGIPLQHPAEEIARHPDGSRWLRFHLRCDRCPLNEKHNAEPDFIAALFAVLDSLWFSGRDEIEVRELVQACRETVRDVRACRKTVRDWPDMV